MQCPGSICYALYIRNKLKKKPRGVRMTSQNQHPQGPSPFDQQPERPITINSSLTTTQPTNTKSTPPQQTILPEQKGPGWMIPSRPMPAVEYQRAISTEEQPALEDQNQTNTTVISKPKRSRQSTKSQKNTQDIQASVEASGNTTGTNMASDTLEK